MRNKIPSDLPPGTRFFDKVNARGLRVEKRDGVIVRLIDIARPVKMFTMNWGEVKAKVDAGEWGVIDDADFGGDFSLAAALDRRIRVKTTDGLKREGRLTAIQMRSLQIGGQVTGLPLAIVFDNDPVDRLAFDSLSSIEMV